MAAPMSSSRDDRSRRGYEVFLNFRGPDTRLTIIDSLYNDMIRAGICTFKDNEELRFGEEIEGSLLQAINESRIYIPIFSKNYASSKWCLHELARIVELSKDNDEKVILPIFYDVDVDDVKLKTNLYWKALQKHKSDSENDLVKKWKKALKAVARIKGRNLKDHGIEMDEIMEQLDLVAFDVRFIAIHGMGGIGKTTLAKAVFRQISPQFSGAHLIKTRLHGKKVLIVLDDIDNRDQIMRLVGSTLRGKCQSTWKNVLSKLKKVMNEDVKKKLMISYEALDPNQQQIYLDIACFFINQEKTTAIKYWDAVFGYPTEIEVNILTRMSLIKIIDYDELWMHDQLRDLGRDIVHGKVATYV
ncbi:TMV resistance protein N-like [Eucalyptus grandis]|uniref:TMV resistance protein N-like n=1 Tax=Eucalyptus grandis TaxID=71139 RepID=UPI00192EDF9A|nr:TMV resistance protein N-like [Eucalyptus grandis]